MAFDNEELKKRRQQREILRKQRIARQRRLMIRLIIAGAVLVLCGILIFVVSRRNASTPSAETSAAILQTTVSETTTETTPPATERKTAGLESTRESTVIHLAAAGDLIVTDKTVDAGLHSGFYDYTDTFLDVAPLLSDADLTLMNFEGNMYGAPFGTQTSSAPQAMLQALRNAGVDMLQTANSCSIDNGLLGLSSTIREIRAAGIEPLGTFSDAAAFRKSGGYTIREVNGVRIAFVAFTKGMDNRGLPEGSEDCVNLLYTDYATTYQKVDTDGINKVLRNAEAANPDITIALLHWGSEYNDQISDTQETILNLMLDGGVDVVLGSHPHFVQQIILDRENHTFIAYSLGDFFGDAERAGSNYSIILNLEITKNYETGITQVTDYTYHPIFTQQGDKGMQVVRIRDAIAAYEAGYIYGIPQEDYDDMCYALTRIEERISGEG